MRTATTAIRTEACCAFDNDKKNKVRGPCSNQRNPRHQSQELGRLRQFTRHGFPDPEPAARHLQQCRLQAARRRRDRRPDLRPEGGARRRTVHRPRRGSGALCRRRQAQSADGCRQRLFIRAAPPRLRPVARRRARQRQGPRRRRQAVGADGAGAPAPAGAIGGFTDFLTSVYHSERGGRHARPDNPVPPVFRYMPIAYNSRASSVRVSGEAVRRPNGQFKKGNDVRFGPTEAFDFELELGVFIGQGNALGEPVAVDAANDMMFGYCLVNDWSARDIQGWESALGPFLAKSVSTSISPWVVTAEAMAPFHAAAFKRPAGDPAPLPYLFSIDDQTRGGLDLEMEVYLSTARMRSDGAKPHRITLTNFKHMYWTFAQMVAHHTSNGCNLRPGDSSRAARCRGRPTTAAPATPSLPCAAPSRSRCRTASSAAGWSTATRSRSAPARTERVMPRSDSANARDASILRWRGRQRQRAAWRRGRTHASISWSSLRTTAKQSRVICKDWIAAPLRGSR